MDKPIMDKKFRHKFQPYLHYRFIHEDEFDVGEVSKKMGIRPSSLYKWISGERLFPVDHLLSFMKATDFDYLKYLAKNCGFNLAPEIKSKRFTELIAELIKILSSFVDLEEIKNQGE